MNEPPTDELTFEQALLHLEQTVRQLEDGQLGLEEALAHYEAGVGLIKRCYGRLREAEQRILQLTGMTEDGKPVLQPFQHEATANRAAPSPPPRAVRRRADEID